VSGSGRRGNIDRYNHFIYIYFATRWVLYWGPFIKKRTPNNYLLERSAITIVSIVISMNKISFWVAVLLVFLGQLSAKEIKRKAYQITVPFSATIDKEDSDLDLDHYTVINFLDGNFMIIMVIDDPSLSRSTHEYIALSQRESLMSPQIVTSHFLKRIKMSGLELNGGLYGRTFVYQIGLIESGNRGYIFNMGYYALDRISSERRLAEVLQSFREL